MRSGGEEAHAIKPGPVHGWNIKRRTMLSRDGGSPTIENPFYSQNDYYKIWSILRQTDEEVSTVCPAKLER